MPSQAIATWPRKVFLPTPPGPSENVTLPFVANYLSGRFNDIVIDQTGLTGAFDFTASVDVDRERVADPTVPEREAVAEIREDIIGRMMDVGLKAIFWSAQAALRHMDPERGGVIINNTSPAAELGVPRSTVYSAIKGGVSSATRSLAVELGPRRIRVNAVCPGTVPTPGAREMNNFDDSLYESRRLRCPLGRNGTPEDVASAAVFLASPEASYISAAILRIDGGTTVNGGA